MLRGESPSAPSTKPHHQGAEERLEMKSVGKFKSPTKDGQQTARE